MQAAEEKLRASASRLIDEFMKAAPEIVYEFERIGALPATVAIFNSEPQLQLAVVHEFIVRVAAMRKLLGNPKNQPYLDGRYLNLWRQKGFPKGANILLPRLLRRKL